MRVCLVSPSPPPQGGIARWSTIVTRYFEESDDLVLAKVNIAPSWRSIFQISVPLRAIGGLMQLWSDIARFLIASKGCDCCHLTTSGQLALARDYAIALICRIKKLPLCYHLHFGRVPDIAIRNTFEWRVLRVVARKASVVIVLDEKTRTTLVSSLPRKRVVKLPNPIDLPVVRTHSSFTDKYNAVFIGWNLDSKGVGDLLDAWKRVGLREWQLDIIGAGDDIYRKAILAKHYSANVRFRGELPHAETLEALEESDLLILPSHTEGFPFVVLEAMAAGKPILATSVGAIPEMLGEEAGLLVEPRNVPELALALKIITKDEAKRKSMGEAGQAKVKSQYQTDVVMKRLKDIWIEAVDR